MKFVHHTPADAFNIANDADVEALADQLPELKQIVLHFPKWTDGRAYSQARLLRTRYRFKGEIRATGEVLVDMMPLLERCGFDAVQLREGESEHAARIALGFFPSGHYQGAIGGPQPVFARP